MFLQFLQNNYACLVLCLLFLIFVITDKAFSRQISVLFILEISIILCLIIVDYLELICAQAPTPGIARRIFSAIGYALRPSIAIVIVLVMLRNQKRYYNWKAWSAYLLLFFVNIICSFVSIGNSCVFGYTKDNAFYRGPLGLLPFITAGIYILLMLIETLIHIKKRVLEETIVVFMIGIICVTGTLLESLLSLDGILNASCVISVVFYYLYIHSSVYSRDTLTNAFNRRIFYLDIENMKRNDAILVGIDLNFLKKMNDEYGHAAGDDALITLTQVIQKNLYKGCRLYRMGGDEFLILCHRMASWKVREMMQTITEEMRRTTYSFAYGLATYHKGDDVETIVKLADERMYEMKKEMKATRGV